MKKVLLEFMMSFMLVSNSFADMTPNMYILFSESINSSNHNLTQTFLGQSSSSKNNLRNSCGTMSALAVHNYFYFLEYGISEGFTSSKSIIENKVVEIFTDTYPDRKAGDFQSGTNLKSHLAIERWNWSLAKIRSTSTGYTYDNMINNDLQYNRPVIALVKNNSVLNSHNFNHFITVLYATSTTVGYYDPWDGYMKVSSKQDFLNSWVYTNYAVVITP